MVTDLSYENHDGMQHYPGLNNDNRHKPKQELQNWLHFFIKKYNNNAYKYT